MTPVGRAMDLYQQWEGAVAFRLFADHDEPTLTVPEQIAATLGDRILDGRLAPGERLIEHDIADAFRVSRGPVRDAIRILERERLLAVTPRRGATVSELSAREVREIFEIRGGLNELVARRVVPRRDPELISTFRAGLAHLTALAELENDGGKYAEITYRLGLIAARACGNVRLHRMLSALSLQTLRYSKLGLASRARRQRSIRLWTDAMDALEQGQTDRYVALARQRIEESGAQAASLLEDAPTARATRTRRDRDSRVPPSPHVAPPSA
jgi:DNA-binding GntR family transcriptional regulator